MTLPATVQTRLSELEARLAECKEELTSLREDEADKEHGELRDGEFLQIFRDACTLVREAELSDAPYLAELTRSIEAILDNGLRYAFGPPEGADQDNSDIEVEREWELFTLMPSWAHDDLGDRPLLKDKNGQELPFPPSALENFLETFQPYLAEGVTPEYVRSQYRKDPWHPSMKQHPKSTPLARFRPDLPELTSTPDKSVTASILDARCEVFSSPCANPITFQMSPSCLAMLGTGGYKNHAPYLYYMLINEPLEPLVDFPDDYSITPGLANVTRHAAIDDSRRLIFVGDRDRVKSYEWGSIDKVYKKPHPIHTLKSDDARGPMTVLPNGSLVRAGKGGASVWDLKVLPTHGPHGSALIGDRIQEFDSWREEEEIERSSGSLPASRIKFFDHTNFEPNLWQPLTLTPSTVICAAKARKWGSYSCIVIDLETGKTASRYLGHGDEATVLSVSPSEPQLFLTACADGFARLFDLRRPLPVITLDACNQRESCESAALAMPDGIPTVFTGTTKSEHIRLWDIRARACVYELSTGNNAVESLAWDVRNNCLYAATQCDNMNSFGSTDNYRYAEIPKRPRSSQDDEADEDSDDDGDLPTDDVRCWPNNAWHVENYFGYLYDAGEPVILRYTFKEDPNPLVLPQYGHARVRSNPGWTW
ncbi:unnamed protein product [Rhizoctonia solani]|uniref:WD40 repeat-like protein n=1 Tax=Rhizoctonia solani TaxID=456999 RepID=A0A8H3C0T6_9AGAM|nr:unnamed protein product [Rhizoctonia solani]